LQHWRQRATSSSTEPQPADAAAPEAAEVDDDPEQQMARLPRPSQYHQAQLSGKERAALRAQSEQLAKSKTLQRVQVGNKGVTLNVLLTIADVLMKHEFVRVKLGEGSGLERKQTAGQLAQLLDAAVVGQVGFTITLYRQKGLPRPDSLTKPGQQL
jgi:RNA-binding protein YhbY